MCMMTRLPCGVCPYRQHAESCLPRRFCCLASCSHWASLLPAADRRSSHPGHPALQTPEQHDKQRKMHVKGQAINQHQHNQSAKTHVKQHNQPATTQSTSKDTC